jgi:hypothetical protein
MKLLTLQVQFESHGGPPVSPEPLVASWPLVASESRAEVEENQASHVLMFLQHGRVDYKLTSMDEGLHSLCWLMGGSKWNLGHPD